MHKKTSSILIITFIYTLAAVAGFLVFKQLSGASHEYWALFVADVVATVIVWAIGL